MSNTAMERLRARQNGGASSGYNPLDSLAPALSNKDSVVYLDANLLHSFSAHPFVERDDEYTQSLLDSIKANGILEPLLVRRHPSINGEYEIIAGHTRNRLGQIAGLRTRPCIICDLNDDEAVIYMVESNIQRPDWLPSEKSASYKAHLDATARICNKKPGRPGENENAGNEFPHFLHNGERVRDIAAKRFGISGRMFEMYIKLGDLTPELLKLVDAGRIVLRAGVQLSFLSPNDQDQLAQLLLQYLEIRVDETQAVDLRNCDRTRWRRILGIETVSSAAKPTARKVTIPDAMLIEPLRTNPKKLKTMLLEPELQERIAQAINDYAAKHLTD